MSSALVPLPTTEPALPVPTFGGAEMVRALAAYRELQAALDKQMPDAIQKIGDRNFRKKSYWRAIATAYALDVECVREEQFSTDTEWGYRVTYRARTRAGRVIEGDGACSSDEKRGNQATEHNIRSHAHTRAFNRAVSNAVGFGEVSAEEVVHEHTERPRQVRGPRRESVNPRTGEIVDTPTAPAPVSKVSEPDTRSITSAQQKRFFSIAHHAGWKDAELKAWLKTRYGLDSSSDITRAQYDEICRTVELEPEDEPAPDVNEDDDSDAGGPGEENEG